MSGYQFIPSIHPSSIPLSGTQSCVFSQKQYWLSSKIYESVVDVAGVHIKHGSALSRVRNYVT